MFRLSMMTFLAVTLVLMHSSLALNVTSPGANAVWNPKQSNTVTWTSVSTDPSTINIVLVNNNANCAPTGMSQVIKQDIPVADGEYEISGLPDVKECDGYQINLDSTSNNGILAQSSPFQISSSGQSVPSVANATTDSTHPALNGTGGTQTSVNGSKTSQMGGTGGIHTPAVANATSNHSNSQTVSHQGKSPNGTAGESSSASMAALPLRTLITASSLLASFLMI